MGKLLSRRTLYQGEAKLLPIRIKDVRTGQPINLTGASFLLWVKRSEDDNDTIFSKLDASFDKTAVSSGYVTVFLTSYDTWREPWIYQAEIRVIKAETPVPVSKLRFELEILPAITPNDWVVSPVGIASEESFGTHIIQ